MFLVLNCTYNREFFIELQKTIQLHYRPKVAIAWKTSSRLTKFSMLYVALMICMFSQKHSKLCLMWISVFKRNLTSTEKVPQNDSQCYKLS